jgi:hypothetical protein
MPTHALLALALHAATSPLASAQADDPPVVRGVEATLLPEVTSRLRSQDLTTVAWGAHLAAKHRVAAVVPALRARLAELAEVPREQRTFAELALLDALVQNEAAPTAAELAPFRGGSTRVPALVLLLRDAIGNREAVLETYRKVDNGKVWIEWLATGATLAKIKDADFTAAVLGRLATTVHVVVRDLGDENHVHFGRGGWGGRFGDGDFDVDEHQPPTVLYEWTRLGEPGDTLWIGGEQPVFLRRVVHTGRRVGIGRSDSSSRGDHQRQRRAWLHDMIGRQWDAPKFPAERTQYVAWRGPESLTAKVADLRAEIDAEYRHLLARCVTAELLTEAATAGLQPTVTLELHDRRASKDEPLPDLPAANGAR